MPVTPNCQRIVFGVTEAFPDVQFGTFKCRHLSSNPEKPWSQHAASEPARGYLANALDITHRDFGLSTDPTHQAWLDLVAAYLRAHSTEFDIRQVLWRIPDHFNHIHVDTWPKMKDHASYTPPCKGGTLVVVDQNGNTATTFGIPPPPPSEGDDVVTRETRGIEAEDFQRWLNAGGYTSTDGNPLVVDGIPGNKTFEAWAKALSDAGWPAQAKNEEAASASAIAEISKLDG